MDCGASCGVHSVPPSLSAAPRPLPPIPLISPPPSLPLTLTPSPSFPVTAGRQHTRRVVMVPASLPQVRNTLLAEGLWPVDLAASGRIQTPEDIVRVVFMGANRVNMGTSLMLGAFRFVCVLLRAACCCVLRVVACCGVLRVVALWRVACRVLRVGACCVLWRVAHCVRCERVCERLRFGAVSLTRVVLCSMCACGRHRQ